MTDAMHDAIGIVMNNVNEWDLSPRARRNLRLAQRGNVGALCDLLTSLDMQNDPELDDFYAEVNNDESDFDEDD